MTVAVDSEQSVWRTRRVGNTVQAGGVRWFSSGERRGGRNMALLMVYPIGLARANRGDTVTVVEPKLQRIYGVQQYGQGASRLVQGRVNFSSEFRSQDDSLFVFQRPAKIQ